MIQLLNLFLKKAFFVILTFVLCNTFCLSVLAHSLTDSQLFNAQQLYGQRVQAKYAANKHLATTNKLFVKSSSANKANFLKSKSFYPSNAALKQFQVQYKVGNSYDVQQFGAKGDGVTDDQAAIDQTIARAQGTGLSVYFPPGNYLHSGLIVSNGIALYGAGASSILTATNNLNGAVKLTGNSPLIRDIVVQYASPLVGGSPNLPDTTPEYSGIWVQAASNFVVEHVTILNSSENDIDVFQSSGGVISANQIITTNTMHDGIQIADSININALNNIFTFSGTSIAIDVLFGSADSQNINLSSNQINLNAGSGIFIFSMLTGQIGYNNIVSSTSNSSYCIAVIGGTQSAFEGHINNLQIQNNSLIGPVQENMVIGDTSGGNDYVTNIRVTNNTLANGVSPFTFNPPFEIYGGTNINFSSNILNGSQTVGVGVQGGGDITIQGNLIENVVSDGIYVNQISNTISGTITVANNSLFNCCTTSGSIIDFPAGGTPLAILITNNNYAGPANNATYYIQCLVPSSGTTRTISGNTQATTLPNNIAP